MVSLYRFYFGPRQADCFRQVAAIYSDHYRQVYIKGREGRGGERKGKTGEGQGGGREGEEGGRKWEAWDSG